MFSQLADIFASVEQQDGPRSATTGVATEYLLSFVYMALLSFIAHYASTFGFVYSGARITSRIKARFLAAVLAQNMAFFDARGRSHLVNQLTAETSLIQAGISQKLGLTISALGTLLATIVISFVLNPKLSGIVVWSIVFGFLLAGIGNFVAVKYSTKALGDFGAATALAEETLADIKTIVALGAQSEVAERFGGYNSLAARSMSVLRSLVGCLIGLAVAAGYMSVALAFWQGSVLVIEGGARAAEVITIALIFKTGTFAVLGVGAHGEAFANAAAAAGKIFTVMERASPIDPTSRLGVRFNHPNREIEFKDVKHVYPSRPSAFVLDKLTVTIPAGRVTAIVGGPGSGKSTIACLLERFYDPLGGSIRFDGQEIRVFNVQSIRENIRVVNQNPVLFDTTIFENIKHGLVQAQRDKLPDIVIQKLVEDAAKTACAHEFIHGLHNGYETLVGSRGMQLSGGQRQRIAIARAIFSSPSVLILDEATAALDQKTESQVHGGLMEQNAHRTTIIVAHRLSTVRNADKIVVLRRGKIVEQGIHAEPLNNQGVYYRLFKIQQEAHHDSLRLHQSYSDVSASIDSSLSTESPETDVWSNTTFKRPDEMCTKGRSNGAWGAAFWSSVKVVASLNKKERSWVGLGFVCSLIVGLEEPISAILFGESIVKLFGKSSQAGSQQHYGIGFYSILFLILALVQCGMFWAQALTFSHGAERLISRARDLVFRAFLNKPLPYFDQEGNSSGALVDFLSNEIPNLTGLSGSTLGTILTASSTIIAGFIVGCSFGWKLALVCSAALPLLVACGFLGIWSLDRLQQQLGKHHRESVRFGAEAITEIQTVAAFSREAVILRDYTSSLLHAEKLSLRSNVKTWFLFASTQSLLFACMGLGFWYGSTLVFAGEYSLFEFAVVYTSILMSACSAGILFSFGSDIGKAIKASTGLQRTLESHHETWRTEETELPRGGFEGKIDLRRICCTYTERPEQMALDNVSIRIAAGQHVALVGETGSGKSTILSLLERFYEPTAGEILLDDVPISVFNVEDYRRQIGLVTQEAALFDGSVRQNLLLGLKAEAVSEEAIQQALKDANLHEAVLSLP